MKNYVVITGASSGIGRELTIRLAYFGYDIIAIGSNEIALQRTKAIAKKTNITMVVADLSKDELDKIVKIFKPEDRVQYLIHCAATTEPHAPLTNVSRQALEKAMSVNVMTPIFLTQKLTPYFNIKVTRVLFIGSDYVGVNNKIRPGITGSYGMSKSALRVIVEYFRHEFKDIAFIGYLNPGSTNTPMFNTLKSVILSQHGMFNTGKPVDPSDVAAFIHAVLVGASDQNYTTTDWDYRNEEHHNQVQKETQTIAIPIIRSAL